MRLVPEDTGFCLLFENLRDQAAAFLPSPFVNQFLDSPIGTMLRNAPEMRKLAGARAILQSQFQIDWPRLRDDILGDAVVLAYRPGPPGKPEQEQGLLLIWARDAKLLGELIERLNTVQQQSGDLRALESREYKGVRYYQRVERKATNYYLLRGPVLAFTTREEMLQRALDLDDRLSAAEEPPVARQLRLLGLDRRLATLWINPRAFEADLEHKNATAQAAEAAALKTLLGYWNALEGVGLSLRLEDDLQVALAVRARTDQLPRATQRFLAEAGLPSDLWSRFPRDAMLAVALRIDVTALVELLSDFLTVEARNAVRAAFDRGVGAVLGKDVLRDIVPYLGPNAGLCVHAPPPQEKAWFPHILGMVQARPGGAGLAADLALLGAVNSYAMLAVLAHNSTHAEPMSLRSSMQERVEVKSLVHDRLFPAGLQPSFALKGGYLVLASSPEAVRRFRAESPPVEAAGEIPLFRLSMSALTQYLTARHQDLILHLVTRSGFSEADAGRRLHNVVAVLQLFDRAELVQRSAANLFTLVLRVRTARPLR